MSWNPRYEPLLACHWKIKIRLYNFYPKNLSGSNISIISKSVICRCVRGMPDWTRHDATRHLTDRATTRDKTPPIWLRQKIGDHARLKATRRDATRDFLATKRPSSAYTALSRGKRDIHIQINNLFWIWVCSFTTMLHSSLRQGYKIALKISFL